MLKASNPRRVTKSRPTKVTKQIKTTKKVINKVQKRKIGGCPFHASNKQSNGEAAATPVSLPPGMTAEEVAIVKSCVPILEVGGEALTKHFYNNMIGEESEVRPFFNPAHQLEASQPRALAFSVLNYAKNIDNLGGMLASTDGQKLIATIVKKHVALQITAPQYQIVGKHLLRAIREVLGPETATDQVITAWGKAYGVLADLLIGLETAEYEALSKLPGGWKGQREFKIIGKDFANEAQNAISYLVQSMDEKPVIQPHAGQYLTLRLKDDKNNVDTHRNYSISDVVHVDGKGVPNTYRFTTQIVDKGHITNYLKQFKNVGDTLMINPPTGEFTLRDTDESSTKSDPALFIAAGSGITPFISMSKKFRSTFPQRPLNILHVCEDNKKEVLAKDRNALQSEHTNVVPMYAHVSDIVNNDGTPTIKFQETLKGLLNKNGQQVKGENIYVVGPHGFMKTTHNVLTANGIDGKKINYEFFGPHVFF